MGKTLTGSVSRGENVQMLTPQQQNFLSSLLGGATPENVQSAVGRFLKPFNSEDYSAMFEKSFVEPSKQALERKYIPAIKESMLGTEESGSSALNQTLAQTATDLSTSLGSQYMNQYNQQQSNLMNILNLLTGMSTQRTFEPQFTRREGILGPLLGAGTQLGGIGLLGLLGK